MYGKMMMMCGQAVLGAFLVTKAFHGMWVSSTSKVESEAPVNEAPVTEEDISSDVTESDSGSDASDSMERVLEAHSDWAEEAPENAFEASGGFDWSEEAEEEQVSVFKPNRFRRLCVYSDLEDIYEDNEENEM